MSSSGSSDRSTKRKPFFPFLISALAMAAWIYGLNWLCVWFLDTTVLYWFIDNGSLISILTGFFALVWKGLDETKGLLAWHPLRFLASCWTLAGVFFMAASANLSGPLDGVNKRADDSVSIIETLWDGVLAPVMNLLMGLAVLAWVVFISPLFYVLTLVTGAPARREIRGTGRRLVVIPEGFRTVIQEQPSSQEVPAHATDVSFGRNPFALTNALNAGVLFILEILVQPHA